jgi:iron complex transport system ATP-binding protein
LNKFWFDAKNINCFKNSFRVIKDLNLKIAYSENVILIGPNGSGKSSLIEIINRNIYPVEANESKLKIFDKELINLWELRKKISTVNNDIKKRINPKLQVFDLILSGLYGRYCYIQNKSERDCYEVEKFMKKVSRPSWLNWLYLFIFILSSIQLIIFWSNKF